MRWSLGALVASYLTLGGVAHATQYVTNGDFTLLSNGLGQLTTNTVATGWSTSGYNFVFTQADQAVNGSYGGLALWDANNGGANGWNGLAATSGNFLAMDGAFETGAVTQTITGLTVGNQYDLSFSYAFGQQTNHYGATTQQLLVGLGSTNLGYPSLTTSVSLPNQGFSGWTTVSETITADASTETLSFLAQASPAVPPFALLSNVSLTDVAAPAPSPATGLLSLTGLAVLLGFARLGAFRRGRAPIA